MEQRSGVRDQTEGANPRLRKCAGCGHQFHVAAGQDSEFCPTCEYRRVRNKLLHQAQDVDGETDDQAE